MIVNSSPTVIFEASKEQTVYSIGNFTGGNYSVQIVKISENHYGPFGSFRPSIFEGVELSSSSLAMLNSASSFARKRKIEIFSDSDSNGYGIDSQGTTVHCLLHMKQYQNCYQGYAYQLGELLNAEMHIEAWSGKGVVRNAIGIPGGPMPDDWTRVTTNGQLNSWDFPASWVPDAVLVWLGANDQLNPKLPKKDEFVPAYVSMLQEIYDSYKGFAPNVPKLIALCMNEQQSCTFILEAVVKFQAEVYENTFFVEMTRSEIVQLPQDYGCLLHLNVQGQTKVANYLYPIIEQLLYGS